MHMYISIYIYVCMHLSLCMYLYIYICMFYIPERNMNNKNPLRVIIGPDGTPCVPRIASNIVSSVRLKVPKYL